MPRDYILWQLPFSAGAKLSRASALRHGADIKDSSISWITDRVDAFLERIGWNEVKNGCRTQSKGNVK